ncbi:hypothetical protein HNP36_000101 [Chryseobacterium shigense]|uniref:Uncharacterized protein n=1 Tax=Chryseobacterium shigense TaxID=297244 RepID=A0A841N6F2_9FLAO|nr:hypothetical protein [Chryseobacterium shigense]
MSFLLLKSLNEYWVSVVSDSYSIDFDRQVYILASVYEGVFFVRKKDNCNNFAQLILNTVFLKTA